MNLPVSGNINSLLYSHHIYQYNRKKTA
jgi:hypothetical protein